jgi:hypothetical protein
MKPTNVLPPGAVLPPLATVDAKGVNTRQASRKGGKRHARGPKRHSGRFATLNAFVDWRHGQLCRVRLLSSGWRCSETRSPTGWLAPAPPTWLDESVATRAV